MLVGIRRIESEEATRNSLTRPFAFRHGRKSRNPHSLQAPQNVLLLTSEGH